MTGHSYYITKKSCTDGGPYKKNLVTSHCKGSKKSKNGSSNSLKKVLSILTGQYILGLIGAICKERIRQNGSGSWFFF